MPGPWSVPKEQSKPSLGARGGPRSSPLRALQEWRTNSKNSVREARETRDGRRRAFHQVEQGAAPAFSLGLVGDRDLPRVRDGTPGTSQAPNAVERRLGPVGAPTSSRAQTKAGRYPRFCSYRGF